MKPLNSTTPPADRMNSPAGLWNRKAFSSEPMITTTSPVIRKPERKEKSFLDVNT